MHFTCFQNHVLSFRKLQRDKERKREKDNERKIERVRRRARKIQSRKYTYKWQIERKKIQKRRKWERKKARERERERGWAREIHTNRYRVCDKVLKIPKEEEEKERERTKKRGPLYGLGGFVVMDSYVKCFAQALVSNDQLIFFFTFRKVFSLQRKWERKRKAKLSLSQRSVTWHGEEEEINKSTEY